MIRFVFLVQGVRDDKDEQVLFDTANQIFGAPGVFFNSLTSMLTLEVQATEPADVAQAEMAFVEQAARLGYILEKRADAPIDTVPPQAEPPISEPLAACEPPKRREHRGIPVSVFVSSLCAVLVLAILATFTLTSELFRSEIAGEQGADWTNPDKTEQPSESGMQVSENFYELEVLKLMFDLYAIEDIDQEELMVKLLKSYTAATGDVYAEYYTAEEMAKREAEDQGEFEGIGVSIVNDQFEMGGFTYSVLHIISVFDNSPALAGGIRVGDMVYSVVDPEGTIFTVDALGYNNSVSCLRGPAGTMAEFTVIRMASDGSYEVIPFSIERAAVISESVKGRVLESDPSIGIIKISQFDLTTPTQFKSQMDSLIASGCTKFIFDVRYNPGGAVLSVEAVLSTLLNEGDLIISTAYKNGTVKESRVAVADYSIYDGYEGCSVTAQDIAKYRGYECVVLVNEYTASSAEIFTSTLRDYDLVTIVGVTTYGKGCVQTTFSLDSFGMEGALQLTTAWYQPPCGENFHGIGITPNIEVEIDEAVLEEFGNVYLVPDDRDPQMLAAIEALK